MLNYLKQVYKNIYTYIFTYVLILPSYLKPTKKKTQINKQNKNCACLSV